MKKIFYICPKRHILLALSGFIILAHILMRQNYEIMHYISNQIVKPINQFGSSVCSVVPFSVAELFIAFLIICFISYTVFALAEGFRKNGIKVAFYRIFITAIMIISAVYAGFCALWGCYFYDDDFTNKSGLSDDPISVEQLQHVTKYFAELANYYSTQVQRNDAGAYIVDRNKILDQSKYVYEKTEQIFPCLEGPEVEVKAIKFSKILSMLDFTGFYFPLTGEANVNMDFPPILLASTVAHEISHQRGVCKEQESNFLAVLSCLEYGDADYCYSACLLAYTHLGNALHSADYDAWEEIYYSLSPVILADFSVNRAYWEKFETPVQKVSNTVYENFMYSYNQDLGLKSYGACVDLLVNYYYEKAVD